MLVSSLKSYVATHKTLSAPPEDFHVKVAKTSEEIYQQLLDGGVDVLLDDRDTRGGVKFNDADLIGIPVRVTVGKKSVAEGNIEIKLRAEPQGQKVPIEKAADRTIELVNSLKEKLKP